MLARPTAAAGALLFVLDTGVAAACFAAAFLLKRHAILPDPALETGPYVGLFLAEAPLVLAVLVLHGLYAPRLLTAGLGTQALSILRANGVAFAAFIVVSFYVRMFDYSRVIFTLFFLLLPAGLVTTRWTLREAMRRLGLAAGGVRRLLVFGGGTFRRELESRLGASSYVRFEIESAASGTGRPSPADLDRIEQGKVDGVVLDLPLGEADAVAEVMGRAEREGVAVYLSPRTLPVETFRPSWEMVGDLPILALHPPSLSPAAAAVKRAADLALAILGLVVLAAPMALLALLVKLTSPGSALLAQRRVGRDGREFTMLKFRTMRVGAEDATGPVWARPDDDRCTPLGRFLRRRYLDELPQLLNVLAGHMSLVGPRPERPEFVRRFKREIDRYPHKHGVRPGITGWAQVNGWTGPTSLDERIRHDLYYIENWSPALDAWILLRTVVIFFRGGPPARPVTAPPGTQIPQISESDFTDKTDACIGTHSNPSVESP